MPSILNATTTNGLVTSADNSGSLQLQTNNGTTAVTIDTSQRVGIGETTPANTLSIKAATATIRVDSSTGTNGVYSQFSNTAGSFYVGRDNSSGSVFGTAYGSYLYSEGAYPVITWVNGSERMRIISSGFVKASNFGSYNNVGASTHEFNTNISNDYAFYVGATNASYAADGLTISYTQRTAANSFAAWKVYTSGGNTLSYVRGDGNAYTDGTWNNNGADYAEFFESATGQSIPVGSTVVLENNKVRIATQSDNPADVIGVVRPKEPSKASMVVGNTAWNKWANKYLTDDFDRYIMEDHNVVEWTDADGKQHSYESQQIPADVVVPADATIKTHDDKGNKFQHYKLNPAWNPDAEYINRENRDEWLIIGLIGQVKVLKGQTMGDRWKKMRDVSDSVEEWFIR